MRYSDFLRELSDALSIKRKTLDASFRAAKVDINKYRNRVTIRNIRKSFDDFLMEHAFGQFSINYHRISNVVHPTKFTDETGQVLSELPAGDVGTLEGDEQVAPNYFLDQLFYDSELERENILAEVREVVVFTKIPRNSIRIPVAGGKTYSPDFAYVIRFASGDQQLNFVVESKNVESDKKLRDAERHKIAHAEAFFGEDVKIHFETQFKGEDVAKLIGEVIKSNG